VYLAACSNRTSIPKDIIPPDSMQKIMREVIMAGEYSVQYISKDSLKPDKLKANQDLMEDIFRLHHTTRAAFKQSLNFYESRPDLNKIIFDSLAADANRHKQELYGPRTNVKPIPVPVKKAP
ncbi:MAG TPA: DUF4296 domain-containing protein, partial [Puia sp.]